MTKQTFSGAATVAACLFGVAFAPGAAKADVLVLDSTAPAVKRGSTLSDSTTLEIAPGQRVVLMLPSGSTTTLAGPVKRPVKDISQGQSVNKALWDQVAGVLSGGGSSQSLGATRSARIDASAKPRTPVGFSWDRVPIDAEGDICIKKGAVLRLARGKSEQLPKLTLVDVQTTKKVDVEFAAGQAEAPWPDAIAVRTGKFAMVLPDQTQRMRQIQLRVIDPLPNADDTARVLHSQKCHVQFEAWVKGLASAN
jgi:hypothetical protein